MQASKTKWEVLTNADLVGPSHPKRQGCKGHMPCLVWGVRGVCVCVVIARAGGRNVTLTQIKIKRGTTNMHIQMICKQVQVGQGPRPTTGSAKAPKWSL